MDQNMLQKKSEKGLESEIYGWKREINKLLCPRLKEHPPRFYEFVHTKEPKASIIPIHLPYVNSRKKKKKKKHTHTHIIFIIRSVF